MKQPQTLPIDEAAPIGIGFGDLLCQVLRLCNKAVDAINNRNRSRTRRKYKKWDNAAIRYIARAQKLQRHNDKSSESGGRTPANSQNENR